MGLHLLRDLGVSIQQISIYCGEKEPTIIPSWGPSEKEVQPPQMGYIWIRIRMD